MLLIFQRFPKKKEQIIFSSIRANGNQVTPTGPGLGAGGF